MHPQTTPVTGGSEATSGPARAWAGVAAAELTGGWRRWSSFACIWLWTCVLTRCGLTDAALGQLGGALSLPNATVLAGVLVSLSAVCALGDRVRTVIGSRPLAALAGALLTAGSALLCVTFATASVAAYVAGSLAGGGAIGLLKIGWGEMFSRMELREGLMDIGLALIASTAAALVLLVSPAPASACALVACAAACSPLAVAGVRPLEDREAPQPPPGAASTISFSWSLLILPTLVALSNGLFLGAYQAGGATGQGGYASLVALGSTWAELAVGALMLLASRMLSTRFGAVQVYSLALLPSVAGLVLAATGAVPLWVAAVIDDLGFSAFYFFMVVYWGDMARRLDRPVVGAYALGYLVFQASQVPGIALGRLVASPETGGLAAPAALTFAAVVLAFFMVSLLVLNDARSPLRQWLTAGEPARETDPVPEACAAISERCGLSPREREVMSLLARGRTAGFVGRALGISPETAKTHMRSIYRKVDVHTQQELMDVVAAETDPAPRT